MIRGRNSDLPREVRTTDSVNPPGESLHPLTRISLTPVDGTEVCRTLAAKHQLIAGKETIDSGTSSESFDNSPEANVDGRHWAFVKPVVRTPPSVDDATWNRNAIDAFVLQRLETEGLPPSPEADRATLVRRLFLDLTGLPPTLDDVDEFTVDRAMDATERLIDRLLASPQFGEKWAIRWLDLARYADSNGFEFDAPRTMWLYRDWVIDAWNRDLPFDQFTAEQLAGDLLPGATDWQRVATGFWRNSAVAPDITTHRFDMLTDRVNTLGAVWFGLTVECAQCHDHKSDPITQEEYYRLYAIFNRAVDEVEGISYAGQSLAVRSPLNGLDATTLVLDDRPELVVTHLKVRGSAAEDGDRVEPGFPSFLHAARCGESDRLSLACWLIDADNPLTPRVAANRLWESIFGIGLVKTSDEFGVRGERPSHPELLDFLAWEFARGGWSQKRMLRSLVSSATYRQTSRTTEELRERDPQNRLLARGPRFRLDAELIRDVALAASGLLSTKLGGPSVFPAQPEGTTEKLEFASFPWNVNPDEDRYRRGLYTHWKRTALYPTFNLFNAPNRMASCTRRERFTTPLQALASLNDPVFFEAAIHLGRRMRQESAVSPPSAITLGFRLCVGRHPTTDELQRLTMLYEDEIRERAGDINGSRAMLGGVLKPIDLDDSTITQWAALSVVANVLLSLDETITKE